MKKIPALLFMLFAWMLSYTQTRNGSITFSDYTFIAPQGWFSQDNKNFLSLSQSQSAGEGCLILVIPPQPSSGNLETDAKNVFDMMYPGWNYRNSGNRKFDLVKGYTAQGLEYCMLEAEMSKLSADGSRYDGYEDGVALVIKAGNNSGIVSVRHNTSLMAHEQCRNQYETWLRFFNSLAINNAVAGKSMEEPHAKRIIGVWDLKTNGVAAGEYVFAANGNYQLNGAIGTSSTTADYRYEYLHLTTYAFRGDGRYDIQGNQLRLIKNGNNKPEVALFRFDKVNHGGSGWIDRIHLRKSNSVDGREYEVCYEKKILK